MATTIDRDAALAALRTVNDPDLRKDLVTLGMVRDLEVSQAGKVSLRVVLTTPACPLKDKIRADVVAALRGAGATEVDVTMDAEVRRAPGMGQGGHGGHAHGPHGATGAADRLPGVKAIVAVGSGKGGVGKSTVATNLAVALARSGAKVGLLDADIYGPSMPVMLGLRNVRPSMTPDEKIAPMERYGLKVMSMGFMIKEDDAIVWRGPMLGKALQQFIEDVEWGELDYLIIDMPPGTGDVQLSLAQLLPVAGSVVVTTPQDVAFADVRRAIKMFQMTHTRVLGLVENMSHFICGHCDAEHHIFGDSRIDYHAGKMGFDVLAKVPLDSVTAVAADHGEPIVVAAPESAGARAYFELAGRISQKLAILSADQPQQDKFKSFFERQPA